MKRTGRFHILTLLLPTIFLLMFGCSTTHDVDSTHYSDKQTELYLDETAEPAENEIAAEEPTYPAEIDELNEEDIPLPTPDDFGSLESETANTDAVEEVAEVGEPGVEYDFPITINEQVEFFLDQFQNSQHAVFGRWLTRSGRYLPMIKEELAKAGLPLDLCYLPMIESGFRLTAYSRARAAGPWQFMRGTAKLYGLTINDYIDERRDPIKTTKAAIRLLADLYEEFQSWPLAVAAYNAGPGRIRGAINKTGSTDFWVLAKSKHIKKETKYYVPKLIAAIIIAKNPSHYGFDDIEKEAPLEFETIEVPRWTAMDALALAAETDREEIYDLNRHLRKAITPPDRKHCQVRVPLGTGEMVARNLPRVVATVATNNKTHIVRKGDTLSGICKKYGIDKKTLLKVNNLQSPKLVAGRRLHIPHQATSYRMLKKGVPLANLGPAPMTRENLVLHKIRPGESISELARRYNVPLHMIAAWNGLSDINRIRAGQTLNLYIKEQKNGTATTEQIVTAALDIGTGEENDLADNSNDNDRLTYYKVRGGDTLWNIARKFKTTPEKIRRWNSLDSNVIHPGLKLMLRIEADFDA